MIPSELRTQCEAYKVVRITKTTGRSRTIIKVDGRLMSDEVSELERVCQAEAHPFSLNLSGLLWAHADGIKAIVRLVDAGAKLTGMRPYIKLLLDRARRRQ